MGWAATKGYSTSLGTEPEKVGLGWVPCSGPVIPNLRFGTTKSVYPVSHRSTESPFGACTVLFQQLGAVVAAQHEERSGWNHLPNSKTASDLLVRPMETNRVASS